MPLAVPSFPTDSIYKFDFIAGFLIVVFSLYYLLETSQKYQDNLNSFEIEAVKHKETDNTRALKDSFKTDYLAFQLEQKINRIDRIEKVVLSDNFDGKEYDNYLIKLDVIDTLANVRFLLEEQGNRFKRISQADSLMLSQSIIIKKLDLLNKERKFNYFVGIGGILVGVWLWFYGALKWLNRIQIPLDRKLQLENEKLALEVEKMRREQPRSAKSEA